MRTFFPIFIISIFILCSCSSEEPNISFAENLELSESELVFPVEGGTKTFEIYANSEWTIVCDENWCVLSEKIGNGNKTITVSVPENTPNTKRTSEIIVTCGTLSRKILVSQDNYVHSITYEENGIRAGDSLVKKQIEFLDPGNSGKNVVWDFSKITITNDNYKVKYEYPYLINNTHYIVGWDTLYIKKDIPEKSVFICTEHNTMYYFQLKDNQLLHLGHENPVTILKYSPRMLNSVYPLEYEDTYSEDYKSTGLYSSRIRFGTEGSMIIEADAYGTIIFPDNIIVKDVIRIKSVQVIIEEIKNASGEKTVVQTKYVIYKWYAKGYRYPVFESHQSQNMDTEKIGFETSFYYPPQDHSYLDK